MTSSVRMWVAMRPADDPAAPGVDDRGEVAGARAGRQLGDVGDPQPVGTLGAEVAVDEIGEGLGILVADRRAHEPPAVDAREMVAPHQPGDPLARDVVPGLGEVGVDPGHAVRPAAAGVGAPDLRRPAPRRSARGREGPRDRQA